MRIELAKSLSGHDKNHIYLIYKVECRYSMLVNGTTHGILNPKKKNKKHFQVIRKLPDEVSELCDAWREPEDPKISQIIRIYTLLHNRPPAGDMSGDEC